MRLSRLNVLVPLPLLLLSACQATMHEALPDAARDKISSTEVVVPIRQSEVYVTVEPAPNSVYVPIPQVAGGSFAAGAAAGGAAFLVGALLGTAIYNARTSQAEAAVKPLRDALMAFNFDEVFRGELKDSLSGVPWMHVGEFQVIKEGTPDSLDRALTDSKAAAVLFVRTDYHLSNAADLLFISARVSLSPHDNVLQPFARNINAMPGPMTALERSLYRGIFVFKTAAPGDTGDRGMNIEAWSANNGAAMRAAIKLGASKLGRMLADDLQRPEHDMTPAKIGYTKAEGFVTVDGVNGRVIATDTDGQTIRLSNDTLVFVTTSAMDR